MSEPSSPHKSSVDRPARRGFTKLFGNRFYRIALVVFLLGQACAAVLYFIASERTDAFGYEIIGGKVFAIQASDSKMYRHELERFGGKAAVMADDLNRWYFGLWKGKRLAQTVALLSFGVAFVIFRAGVSCPEKK
jgi:hypothetical protein